MGADRTLLGASVGPVAAFFIVRDSRVADFLEAKGGALVIARHESEGRQLLAAAAQLRESARQYAEVVTGARIGNAELPTGGLAAGSSQEPSSGSGRVTVRWAAEQLGVGDRQVINLVRSQILLGSQRRRGGSWHIDRDSVLAEKLRREHE